MAVATRPETRTQPRIGTDLASELGGSTMVVRLRAAFDTLAVAERIVPLDHHARAEAVERARRDFLVGTSEIREMLEARHDVRWRSSAVTYAEPAADVLAETTWRLHDVSAEPVVLHYEPLVASQAYAVTASRPVIDELRSLESVEEIHPNYVYDLPDLESDILAVDERLWYLGRIGAPEAWQRSRGKGVRIAVLDTGIDLTHRELSGVTPTAFAQWDRLGQAVADPKAHDTLGHGTAVASLLFGPSMGIAPEATLLVGLVAPRGLTTFVQMSQGIEWAARQGADIISMSVGRPGYRGELQPAIGFANGLNVLLVAAIGNSGPGLHRSPGDYKRALSVGATDDHDAVWENTGGGGIRSEGSIYIKPDIYAPGVGIRCPWLGGGYRDLSGTSLATPLVAGTAALLKSLMPRTSVDDLRQHILDSSAPISIPTALGGPAGRLLSADRAIGAIS